MTEAQKTNGINRLWRKLTGVLGWSARRRNLALEAVGQIAIASFALRFRPFRRVAAKLGREQGPDFKAGEVSDLTDAHRVAHAVQVAARNVPWRAECLPQAIAAKRMLDRRGIPNALVFGARRADPEFEAHAWIMIGDAVVIGGEESRGYQVLTVFS